MKYLSLYTIPVGYLLVYLVLILFTGLWLFLLSQGLGESHGGIETLIDTLNTPESKSIEGFIEVAAPHLFAIGGAVFVVSHFMLFSTKVSEKRSLTVFLWLFLFTLLDIFSYGLISMGLLVSGWIKLLSMGLFVVLFLLMISMVAVSL